MGFRFRKSFGNKFFRVTFSNKGVSTSAGVPGAHVSVSSKGKITKSVGIPGSGVYYTKSSKFINGSSKNRTIQTSPGGKPPKNYNVIAIVLLILFFPAGLPIMWGKTNWNKIAKIIITAAFALIFISVAFDSGSDIVTTVTALVFAAYSVSVPFWCRPKMQELKKTSTENQSDRVETTGQGAMYFENGIKVYINTKTNVCHFSPDCPAYKNANSENKKELLVHSANALIGYDLCQRCSNG